MMNDIFLWLKEVSDRIFLSDHEYKKKYCPHLYHYLFEMNDEQRHNVLENYKKSLEGLIWNGEEWIKP